MLEERERFHRAARLGRHDEQRPAQVAFPRPGGYRARIGAVQHVQPQPAIAAQRQAEDLRRQAGAAHAQQQGLGVSGSADFRREGGDVRQLRAHGLRQVQPAQAVGDLSRVRLPDGVVMGPDAGHHPRIAQLRQRLLDICLVSAQAAHRPFP